jgi:hypothetical protein
VLPPQTVTLSDEAVQETPFCIESDAGHIVADKRDQDHVRQEICLPSIAFRATPRRQGVTRS